MDYVHLGAITGLDRARGARITGHFRTSGLWMGDLVRRAVDNRPPVSGVVPTVVELPTTPGGPMFDHRYYDDLLWHDRRDRLADAGRLSHLVFVDGRLVDAWSERVEESSYADVARRHDEDLRPQAVQGPPPLPRHVQALHWLDAVAGSREELLAMTASPVALPRLRDHLDPVVDESWLVIDELLTDLREQLLPADLAAPLRECLLLVRDRLPELAERMTPPRVAGGIAWVVGKANAAIGPEGPLTQVRIADRLGTTSLSASGNQVLGHVRRLGWNSARPWATGAPALLAVGRVELLSATVRRDLVELRDRSLAEERSDSEVTPGL